MDVSIKDLYVKTKDLIEKDIIIKGWIRTNRSSNKFGFIEVNDGTFFKSVQVVYEQDLIDNFDEISKAGVAAAIEVEGLMTATPEAKQDFEIKATKIKVLATSNSDYPLQKKRHSLEFLREIAHLRPRSNTFSAVFRVRSLTAFAIHKFFQDQGFVYVHTPIVTGSDCEGAGEMFRVTTLDMNKPPRDEKGNIQYSEDFFGKETSLTVSGQLEAESYAMAFKKVYTFGPTFRAENSNTARHASEFWMIEPEVAFANLASNMELAEDMIKYIINYVLENAPEEMKFFSEFVDKGLLERLDNIANSSFGKITYTEAVELLKESKKEFQFPVEWGIDLQTEHERYITEEIFKKPVFVTDYPKDIKAFYMRMNEDEKTVAAMDLLVPGVGEIIGGSQREERFDRLVSRIKDMGLNEEDYWWYLDLRKYGGVEHAGFGLGFERIIMYLTGMSNIRDVIPFPRTPKTAEF
jgi:asparaginyl-tRNA synthetase